MVRDKIKSVGSFMGRHHMAMMVLCCLIPIGIVVLLSVLGVRSSGKGLGSFVYLLCPIMMIAMMLMPGHNHGQQGKGDGAGESCRRSEGRTINITNDPDRVREGR